MFDTETENKLTRRRKLSMRIRRAWHSATGKPPVCENLQGWAAARPDTDCRILVSARRFTRELPETIESVVDRQYIDRQVAKQDEKYLVRISQPKIVGQDGLVILPDGAYSSESVYTRSVLERAPDYYAPKRRPTVAKSGNYFSLLVIWSKSLNYYHWLHDTVERLFRVQPHLPEDIRYIVPLNLQPIHLETLRLVGIREDQLSPFDGEEVWQLERLYFSNCTTHSGHDWREADEWLRDGILEAYQIDPKGPTRRLFLSRRLASSRRVINEPLVEEYLEQFGFETCMPEALTFREQVELFSQAQVVVSIHGAGLTNILFAPAGLIVVDMIPPSKMENAYLFWTMSVELRHRYWYFAAEDVAGGRDAYVPIEKLAKTIELIQLD
jgi:capsular polysaccharide biosynthesis protein